MYDHDDCRSNVPTGIPKDFQESVARLRWLSQVQTSLRNYPDGKLRRRLVEQLNSLLDDEAAIASTLLLQQEIKDLKEQNEKLQDVISQNESVEPNPLESISDELKWYQRVPVKTMITTFIVGLIIGSFFSK